MRNLDISWETGDFQSHSSANQLWGAGIKPIVLGPGSLAEALSTDESISFSQACRASELYLQKMQHCFK